MKVIWKWFRAFALFGFLVFGSQAYAEGSWQIGLKFAENGNSHNQILSTQRPLYIDILDQNEVINIHVCESVSVTIYDEADNVVLPLTSLNASVSCTDDFNSTLSGGFDFTPASVGTYRIEFSGTSSLTRFDIYVKPDGTTTMIDPREDQGRLWAYELNFNAGSFSDSASTSANLYAVADGGFTATYYVWELNLDHFAGYVYTLLANNLGLNSPNSNGVIVAGMSAPSSGNSISPLYKVYFSKPEKSYPRPTVQVALSNFKFIDDAGVDNTISPSDTLTIQDTGNFFFNTNLTSSGTYTISIDVNGDGVVGSGDVFLNGVATPGQNTVHWNGKDNNGNTIPNGAYQAQIVLKTGEFHFTGEDVETSGGPGSNGLTINAVLADGSIDTGNKVYWDDKTVLNSSDPKAYNGDGQYKYHNWGTFSSSSIGNQSFMDTYTFGTLGAPVFAGLSVEPDDTVKTKLTGNIFDDANGNGVRDPGESGLSNITVVLTEPNGTLIQVSTDSNGTYEAYTGETGITVDINEATLPSGYIQTGGVDPETIVFTNMIAVDLGSDGFQNNQEPVAKDDPVEITEDETVIISLLDNDYDAEGDTLTVTSVNPSSNGATISWSADGTLTYTPSSGFIGTEILTYIISDGKGHSAEGKIIIDVLNDANDSIDETDVPAAPPAVVTAPEPKAIDDVITVTEYGQIHGDLSSNDILGDGTHGEHTWEVSTPPQQGSLLLNADGSFVYTPEADINGETYIFSYSVKDANGNSDVAEVVINVNCASSQTSDSGDALGTFSMLMMILLTMMSGLYMMRKEERGEA